MRWCVLITIIAVYFRLFLIVTATCTSLDELLERSYTICLASSRCRTRLFIELPNTLNSIDVTIQKSFFDTELLGMLEETRMRSLAMQSVCSGPEEEESVLSIALAAQASEWLQSIMENYFVCKDNEFLNEEHECICRHDKICLESAEHVLLLSNVVLYVIVAVLVMVTIYYFSIVFNRVYQIDQWFWSGGSGNGYYSKKNDNANSSNGINVSESDIIVARRKEAAAAQEEQRKRNEEFRTFSELKRDQPSNNEMSSPSQTVETSMVTIDSRMIGREWGNH